MTYCRETEERQAAETTARIHAVATALRAILPPAPEVSGFGFVQREGENGTTPGRAYIETGDGTLRLTVSEDLKWTHRHRRGCAWASMPRALPVPETPASRHWQMLRHCYATGMKDSRGPDAEAGFDLARDPAVVARDILRRVVEPALAWAPTYQRAIDERRGEVRAIQALARTIWLTVYDGAPPNDRHLAVQVEHDGRQATIRPHRPGPYPQPPRLIRELTLNGGLDVKLHVPERLALPLVEAMIAFERENMLPTTTTTENQA